jgi:hypothetical protein
VDYSGSIRRTKNLSTELTWAEIFAAIGPALLKPAGPRVLETQLLRYIQENKGLSPDVDRKLYATDVDTIKIQLTAHGFIRSFPAKTEGGGVMEFLELTDLGQQLLLEVKSIRKAIPTQ